MANLSMFAHMLAGWEVVLLLALVLILFGAKHLPEIARGLGEGFSQFRKACDQVAHDAGKSVGGIYGKPAAQALTPDNQTAELYDLATLRNEDRTGRATKRIPLRGWGRLWRFIWHSVRKRLKAIKASGAP